MSDEVVHLLVGASGGIVRARCGVTAKSERKLPATFSSWASDVTCTSCVPAEVAEANKSAAEAKKAAAESQAARMQTGDVTLPGLARQAFGIEALIYVNLSYATFGVVEVAGKITEAAPIAAWSIGKSLTEFVRWVKSKGGTLLVTATNEYL